MTSRFTLSLMVALCSTAAVIAWFNGASLGFRHLLNCPPMAGMYGASARDIHRETPAETEARLRRDREILTELAWSIRVSRVSAALALLAALVLIWRCRMDPLRRQLATGLLASIALAAFLLVLVV